MAKEYNDGQDMNMFAAAPPGEAFRFIISWAASWSSQDTEDRAIIACDISRALFHAPAGPNMFVELPEEDKEESQTDRDMV